MSWASYWAILAIITVFYYIFICFKFYRAEIRQLITGKSNLFARLRTTKKIGNRFEFIDESQQELFPVINQFVQEIKMFLQGALQKNLQREEIVYAFQLLLKKYSSIKGTPFQSIINNYIINECSTYCSIHLDEDELNMLWEK